MYSSSDFVNVVTYQCNDGLQFTQLELSRTCTATGWDKEALPCSKYIANRNNTNDNMENLKFNYNNCCTH